MRIHEITPKEGSKRRRRRVGRGIAAGQGASCGFGMRGKNHAQEQGQNPDLKGDKCLCIAVFPN